MTFIHNLTETLLRQGNTPTRLFVKCAFLVIAVLGAQTAKADVYSFVAEDGTTHFSDQPTDTRYAMLLSVRREPKTIASMGRSETKLEKGRSRYAGSVASAALSNRVEAALLHAVIEIESAYNPNAVSPKGALGLMQLMPDTAKRYGVRDPLNSAQNLQAGARHLRQLLDQFSENKELALAAYNAGPGAVISHGYKIPPYAETVRYVPAVLQTYERLSKSR